MGGLSGLSMHRKSLKQDHFKTEFIALSQSVLITGESVCPNMLGKVMSYLADKKAILSTEVFKTVSQWEDGPGLPTAEAARNTLGGVSAFSIAVRNVMLVDILLSLIACLSSSVNLPGIPIL